MTRTAVSVVLVWSILAQTFFPAQAQAAPTLYQQLKTWVQKANTRPPTPAIDPGSTPVAPVLDDPNGPLVEMPWGEAPEPPDSWLFGQGPVGAPADGRPPFTDKEWSEIEWYSRLPEIPDHLYLEKTQFLFTEGDLDVLRSGSPFLIDDEEFSSKLVTGYRELQKVADDIRKAEGEESLLKRIDMDHLQIRVDGLGKMELTRIEGIVVTRLVDERTEMSFFLLIESDLILNDWAEFQRLNERLKFIVAKQHKDAGNTRKDSESGRDTVILVIGSGGELRDERLHNRPPPWTAQWWSDFKRTTLDLPSNRGDAFIGAVAPLSQMGFIYGMFTLASLVNDFTGAYVMPPTVITGMDHLRYAMTGPHIQVKSLALTGVMGAVIGYKLPVYRAAVNRPSNDIGNPYYIAPPVLSPEWFKSPRMLRTYKAMSVSMFYFIAQRLLNWNVSPESGMIAMFLSAVISAYFTNIGGAYWRDIARFDEMARQRPGNFKIKFPVLRRNQDGKLVWGSVEWDTKASKSKVFNQLQIEMLRQGTKFLDIFGITAAHFAVTIGETPFKVSIPMALIIAIPAANYIMLRMAENMATRLEKDPLTREKGLEIRNQATLFRQKWEALWGRDVREIPKRAVEIITKGLPDARFLGWALTGVDIKEIPVKAAAGFRKVADLCDIFAGKMTARSLDKKALTPVASEIEK
jgi:hypothetical protein